MDRPLTAPPTVPLASLLALLLLGTACEGDRAREAAAPAPAPAPAPTPPPAPTPASAGTQAPGGAAPGAAEARRVDAGVVGRFVALEQELLSGAGEPPRRAATRPGPDAGATPGDVLRQQYASQSQERALAEREAALLERHGLSAAQAAAVRALTAALLEARREEARLTAELARARAEVKRAPPAQRPAAEERVRQLEVQRGEAARLAEQRAVHGDAAVDAVLARDAELERLFAARHRATSGVPSPSR